jgi:hypothetical protein
MSDEVDEMSAASRGSQPVAWWVTLPGRDFPYLSHIQERAIFCQKDEPGSEVVPLYRQPALTDEEREAIERDLSWLQWCEDNGQIGDVGRKDIAALRGLLERTK